MSGEELFDDLPEVSRAGKEGAGGAPRLRAPVRDQIELRVVDIDSLIGADHPARVIWCYLEGLDLSVLEDAIRAREGVPGHPPIAPRLMLGLWLYATSDGVGSARALARLCENHDAYRWLCGGVSVNYHTLSDFRLCCPDLLDDLLTRNVAALSAAGAIDLDEVVQDGVRVRAAAGSSSFRRKKSLRKELGKAERLVARLKREAHDDPEASNRRIVAARQRAARERQARVEAALGKLVEIEAERERRARTNKAAVAKQSKPRASTTDPQARVMKMADGGFRPAYNCQLATVAQGQVVVGLGIDTTGSDRGRQREMLGQIEARYERWPKRLLIDGGFNKNDDTQWAAERGVKVYGPPAHSKHGTDPYAPRARDKPGVAAWRRRMKSAHGKAVYKRRAPGECINARFRQWDLHQFSVRGCDKVTTVLRWFALANNILQTHRITGPTPA
jgi:transposase